MRVHTHASYRKTLSSSCPKTMYVFNLHDAKKRFGDVILVRSCPCFGRYRSNALGYIAMLAVDEVLRGKGIGSCLVR